MVTDDAIGRLQEIRASSQSHGNLDVITVLDVYKCQIPIMSFDETDK